MSVRPEPRLLAYVFGAAASLLAAVVLGQPQLLVAGAPLVALAAIGTADRRPPLGRVAVEVERARLHEGDEVDATLVVDSRGAARHDVVLVPGPGLAGAPEGPVGGIHLAAHGDRRFEVGFRLRATTWGRHPLGIVHVRSRRPWSLLVWEQAVPAEVAVRVLPPTARITKLLAPVDPTGSAGPHRSRARGHGSDLAELRPYQPGDRLRDVSWSATARTGVPWVAEHHPERTGTVLLLLDTMGDGTGPSSRGFARVAGAAWSLASAHLRAGDRVGILGTGPVVTWLPPAGGRRARLVLLDGLLAVAGPGARRSTVRTDVRTLLPTDALVVGLTMLQSDVFGASLIRHRRAGRTTVALAVDPIGAPEPAPPLEVAARDLWRADIDRRRATLARGGIATAVVTDVAEVPAAVRSLTRRVARPALRRAR